MLEAETQCHSVWEQMKMLFVAVVVRSLPLGKTRWQIYEGRTEGMR